ACAGFEPVLRRHLSEFADFRVHEHHPSLVLSGADCASDGSWCWDVDPDVHLSLAEHADLLEAGSDVIPDAAPLPRLRNTSLRLPALGALVGLIRWAVNRLFLLKVAPPASCGDGKKVGRVWIYVPRQDGSSADLPKLAVEPATRVDLLQAAKPSDLATLVVTP